MKSGTFKNLGTLANLRKLPTLRKSSRNRTRRIAMGVKCLCSHRSMQKKDSLESQRVKIIATNNKEFLTDFYFICHIRDSNQKTPENTSEQPWTFSISMATSQTIKFDKQKVLFSWKQTHERLLANKWRTCLPDSTGKGCVWLFDMVMWNGIFPKYKLLFAQNPRKLDPECSAALRAAQFNLPVHLLQCACQTKAQGK